MTEELTLKQRDSKTVRAWYMFDWANSVYNLVITTTFFPIYFAGVTASAYGEDNVPFLGRTFKNSSLYDYALATAYLFIALLLPILSSIADSYGNKKRFMQFFCYLGGLACIGLFWFKGEQPSVAWGLGCFMLAATGYIGSLVFYNSYLPDIAKPEDHDRISAKGFSFGYLGASLLQIIGFGLVVYFSAKGDNTSGPLFTFLLVGLWWIGFAQITFFNLPKSLPPINKPNTNFLTNGFVELKKVFVQIKSLKTLKWFLVAFLFYNMGVQTVMLAATMFGQKALGLPADKLIITILLMQFVAIAGATIISRLSNRFGNIYTLMGVVLLWVVICITAYFVAVLKESGQEVELYFYVVAVGVGLVMGGVQALSRSTYSKLMPPTRDTASFFSFYDVTEKISIVIGIFTFGYIDELFGMKHSVLALIVFFAIGFAALWIAKRKEASINPNLHQ